VTIWEAERAAPNIQEYVRLLADRSAIREVIQVDGVTRIGNGRSH
jgi:hypothetical protein